MHIGIKWMLEDAAKWLVSVLGTILMLGASLALVIVFPFLLILVVFGAGLKLAEWSK